METRSSERDSFTTADERYYNEDRNAEVLDDGDYHPRRRELHKVLAAFCLTTFSAFLNFFLLVVVHDHTPKTAPLPDVLFMIIPQQRWAWVASDWMSFIAGAITVTVIVLHRHRWLVLRRAFTLFGIMFGLRSLCLATTLMPPSFEHREETCYPQANWTHINMWNIGTRFAGYMVTMGLTSGQDHILCGDLMFSGHTTVLTLMCLLTQRYSPRAAFWLRWLQKCLCYAGIVFVAISGGHYTIDVLIAYWLATHVFYAYHQQFESPRSVQNRQPLASLWWFSACRWLESNSPTGRLSNDVDWPLNWPPCVIAAFDAYNAKCRRRRRRIFNSCCAAQQSPPDKDDIQCNGVAMMRKNDTSAEIISMPIEEPKRISDDSRRENIAG